MSIVHRVIPISLGLGLLIAGGCSRSGGGGGGDGRELAYRGTHIAELEDQVKSLKDSLALKNAELEGLRNQTPNSDNGLANELDDIADVSMRGDEVVISVGNEILFRPGQATLSNGAKAALGRIVAAIKQRYPGQRIRVEGHTDSEPIRRSSKKWESNWDLSGARSYAVLKELIAAGIQPERLYFAGFGEFQPKAPNTSREGKAQNRRVEIVVLPAGR